MRAERTEGTEGTERVQRSRRGHRGVVGARKERAANPEANVVGCKVKDAAMWLGVVTAALRRARLYAVQNGLATSIKALKGPFKEPR